MIQLLLIKSEKSQVFRRSPVFLFLNKNSSEHSSNDFELLSFGF